MDRINIPKEVRKKIFETVDQRANEFGYLRCDRAQSGRFMDLLVDDPDVGGLLNDYMPKSKVRTYIKDTILNRYKKMANSLALATMPAEIIIREVYGVAASFVCDIVSKGNVLSIFHSEESYYVVSSGTVLKWETALRKALEIIASKQILTINGKTPFVCLKLSACSQAITDADKEFIQSALGSVGVKAVFCDA